MAFGSGVGSEKKALNGSKKEIPTNPNFLLAKERIGKWLALNILGGWTPCNFS